MKITGILSVITFLVLGAGCSGSAEAVKNAQPGKSLANANHVDQKANADSAATPTATPATIGAQVGRRRATEVPQSAPPPPLQFRAAGEDSEIATSMNPQGEVVETRIFRSHPKLARAEAVWRDPGEALLKISLRDGKVLEVKTRDIANLQSATALDLLKAAGMSTRPGAHERGKTKKTPVE